MRSGAGLTGKFLRVEGISGETNEKLGKGD
jgi:hypothetical protein